MVFRQGLGHQGINVGKVVKEERDSACRKAQWSKGHFSCSGIASTSKLQQPYKYK